MKHCLIIFTVLFIACNSEKTLYQESIMDKEHWVVEQQSGGTVLFQNNEIEINDAKGCTLWLKHRLVGSIKIEYDVVMIDSGGVHDRVSDLNCFWMSNDPKNKDDFFKNSKERAGKFTNYHELTQYYVGFGGHNNTKTRFRRYDGNIERPLLPQHDLSDPRYLLSPNTSMHITILARKNHISFFKDDLVVFEIIDSKPYTSGYFGFRTVNNHMLIKNFKVSKND